MSYKQQRDISYRISGHGLFRKFIKYVTRDKYLLLLFLPVFIYYFIFHYIPMYGVIIAFKDFSPGRGIIGSQWVGIKWFAEFFNSIYFVRLLRNTVLLSGYSLLWGFPVPIIFALILNEVKADSFKKTVQTISYLPYFISIVVIVGMMVNFLSVRDGIINLLLKTLGMETVAFMSDHNWFRTLYVTSGIWQNFGYSSIIYLAVITSIDQQLYEASKIDGANRWKQVLNITLPGIVPTAMILLILSIGGLMSVGFEKIILMYNPSTYETGDVISTYVYRKGIVGAQFSFGAAVGLFNSGINFLLLIAANWLSKRFTQNSLW